MRNYPMSVTRYFQIYQWKTDEDVVRYITHSMLLGGKEPILDIPHLEERTNLPKIQDAPVMEWVIAQAVGDYNSQAKELDSPSLTSQVDSLLEDVDDQYWNQLQHFFRRIITGNYSRYPTWAINQQDLDHVSASLFILHQLSTSLSKRIDWIQTISEELNPYFLVTRFGRTIPRPDNALLEDEPEFIRRAKLEVNALTYEPLREICKILSRKKGVQALGRSSISELLKIPPTSARHIASIFNLTLTERFIPHYPIVGLRQRWSWVNPDLKRFKGDTNVSLGLVEKYKINNETIPTILLQIEPIYTQEPDSLSKVVSSFLTDYEMISFRLDKFDTSTGTWNHEPWVEPERWCKKPHVWDYRKRAWLLRRTDTESQQTLNLNRKQVELLSVLTANQGSPYYRRLLTDLLEMPKTTIPPRIQKLSEYGALSVLYHPVLEYSGLSGGIMLQISDTKNRDRDLLMKWLVGSMPYAHIYWGIENSLVAILRVPGNLGAITYGFLAEYLERGPFGLSSDDFLLALIEEHASYYLTFPRRLYHPNRNEWRDPWNRS